MDTEKLHDYFARLGLRPEIADIYLALHTHGAQTLSGLARISGVERVQIYRLLDELKTTGLVEVETHYKRSILRAAPFENTKQLLYKRDQELRDLKRDFLPLAESFSSTVLDSATTRVRFYEGIDGLKQMAWNQTRGKGENLSILYDSPQHDRAKNFEFFARWVHECNRRDIRFRGIIGEHFIQSQQIWYATHSNERLRHWESRFISEHDFPIPYSMVIYDDTVLYYNWSSTHISGVEITNSAIARIQRQLFELLWQRAEPIDDISGPRDRKTLGKA